MNIIPDVPLPLPDRLGSAGTGRNAAALPFDAWLLPQPAADADTSPTDIADAGQSALLMQLQGAGTMPQTCLIELEANSQDGRTEHLVFPWALSATGRLSYVGGDAADLAPMLTRDVAAQQAGTASSSIAIADQPRVAAPAPLAATDAAGGTAMAVTGWNAPSMSAVASAKAGRADGQGAWGEGAMPWVAQLMRWIERDGGDATMWVRDYAMDEPETRRVVEGLQARARENGLELQRIVVNGREMWRSPTPSREGA